MQPDSDVKISVRIRPDGTMVFENQEWVLTEDSAVTVAAPAQVRFVVGTFAFGIFVPALVSPFTWYDRCYNERLLTIFNKQADMLMRKAGWFDETIARRWAVPVEKYHEWQRDLQKRSNDLEGVR